MFGPVFRSELVRTARRRRHLLVRALYCGLLLLLLWLSYYSVFVEWAGYRTSQAYFTIGELASFAQYFFGYFAALQLIVSVLVTAAITAGTIAEERDRRTIEYLFATGLTNGEIVLDKLAVRLLHMTSLLLAAVPILALSMLFGGVGIAQLAELCVLMIGTVVGTASLSLYISVTTRRARDALIRLLVLLFALLVMPIFVRAATYGTTVQLPPWAMLLLDELQAVNPFWHLMSMLGGVPSGLSTGADALVRFVRDVGLASLMLVALSVWRVRRIHLRAAGRGARGRLGRWRGFVMPPVGNWPLVWKELFTERLLQSDNRWAAILPLVLTTLAFAAIVALFGASMLFIETDWVRLEPQSFVDFARVTQPLLACVFLLLAAGRSAVSISHERERSTWDILLTTTVLPHEVVLAKMAGVVYVLRGLIYAYALIWGLELLIDSDEWWRGAGVLGTTAILGMTLMGMGLLISQRAKSSTRAMSWALGITIVLGGGYLFVAVPLSFIFLRDMQSEDVVFTPCLVFLVGHWSAYDPDMHYYRRGPDELSMYLVGCSWYAMLGLGLLAANVMAFERFARGVSVSGFYRVARGSAAPARLDDLLEIRPTTVETSEA